MALALFASTTKDSQTSSSTITCPANVEAGDLIVIFDVVGNSSGTPTEVVDADFTKIVMTYMTSTRNVRTVLSYKIADGTEGGTTFDRMASNAGNGGTALGVFRDSAGPITAVNVSTPTSETTNNDPASQSILAGAAAAPVILLGGFVSSGAIDPITFSTTATGDIFATGNGHPTHLKYKLYDSSPADTTIDMDDEGYANAMVGCFIELTVEAGLSIEADAGSFTLTGIDATFSGVAKLMAADVAAFVLTGVAATLNVTLTMTISAASFTLTGIAAALAKSKVLAAEVGSFLFTGWGATIPYLRPRTGLPSPRAAIHTTAEKLRKLRTTAAGLFK